MEKICCICSTPVHYRARTGKCFNCRKKESQQRYILKNKQKINSYQKEYRETHREICNLRCSNSYRKNSEYYNSKGKINYRTKNNISLDDPFKKRKNGEGTIDSSGYKTISCKGHANQMDKKGRIREHVFLMAEHLGRPLHKGEQVHHKNGDRLDNRIENLELWSKSHPPGQRVEDKIKWYIEFLSLYGYKICKE